MKKPPVIAILGHVDHGKSTLLDALRKSSTKGLAPDKSDITAGEAGGITQTIGAYQLKADTAEYTFIDTPGHEAFAKMRARGARVADIAILVVAADDGVKPQTLEALGHIQAAKTPMIVAINKIDTSEANADKVKAQLTEKGVLLEGRGGTVPVVEISARTGKNLPELLEMIGLVYEMSENTEGDENAPLAAAVIESKRNAQVGPVVNVIIKKGKISVGDRVYCNELEARVRALVDENGKKVEVRLPGQPVQIVGFKEVLPIGSVISGVPQRHASQSHGLHPQKNPGTFKNYILKADSQGTLQALVENIKTGVIVHSGVGEITESDVLLAVSTKSAIIGFRVKPSAAAIKLAEHDGIGILTGEIIYRLAADMEKMSEEKRNLDVELGRAKIVKLFKIGEQEIAGCIVEKGKLTVGDLARALRGKEIAGEGEISQLKYRAEEITAAKANEECGVLLSAGEGKKLKFGEGDVIVAYRKGLNNE